MNGSRSPRHGVHRESARTYTNSSRVSARSIETRCCLPGATDHMQSRYLEAAVGGIIIGCVYLPNGNPPSCPKFTYKLAWFEPTQRLCGHVDQVGASGCTMRRFQRGPTDFDIYDIRSRKQSALLQPESRAGYAELLDQGWTDALRHLFSQERVYAFWDYFRNHWQRNSRRRIDHVLLTPDQRNRLKAAGVDRFVRNECHASDHAPVWIELRDQSRGKAAGELRSGGTSRPPKRAAGSNKHI